MSYQWTVSSEESGITLASFLRSKLPIHYSARAIKRAIESNCCQVNGRTERFASYALGIGDRVLFLSDQLMEDGKVEVGTVSFSFEAERILYEDSDLLMYNKPSGVASDSQEFLKEIKGGKPFLALVHRLDRETTGVLIFAKTEHALAMMISLFKKRLVHKSYLAIVDGVPEKQSGLIDNYLGALRRYQGQAIWGEVLKAKGLHAVTEWQVEKIDKDKDIALLRCFPKTGRTHQIRVHLSGIGHPILGDYQYGKKFRTRVRAPRVMLHAESVSFENPHTGKVLEVVAPIPADFFL